MANKKIRIRLKAYEHRTLDTAAAKIVESATRTGAQVAGPIPLPTERSLYTIIRATHKYKDSREQFEMRTHKRLIDILVDGRYDKSKRNLMLQFRGSSNQRIIDVQRSLKEGKVIIWDKLNDGKESYEQVKRE